MRKTVVKAIMVLAALLVAAAAATGPVHAAVVAGDEKGWQLAFDGMVNVFAVYQNPDEAPAGVQGIALIADDETRFRIRTGLLPSIFGFTVKAPTAKGLDLAARVGFYPQVQNNTDNRTEFTSQIDLREFFVTVDGAFGQVLAGRALNLYQGRNILTDMTLLGVGVESFAAGGTTLGRIGYGYLYAQFGPQFRYTTPSIGGAKLALSVVDPSPISGSGISASDTRYPGYEGELSYAGTFGGVAVQAWGSGLYQQACLPSGGVRTAWGWAAGLGAGLLGAEVLVSGFGGQGLGSFFLLDVDSLDAAGEERDSLGFLVQGTYTLPQTGLGTTKLGLSYGQNDVDETSRDEADRAGTTGTPGAHLERRKSWTAGVYHDVTANLKVVAEFTRATAEWFDGSEQDNNVGALGTIFTW